MDENLKMPSVLKASVAVDVKLPFGIVGSLEGIYNKDLRTVLFRNANLVDPQPLNVAGYPDNRMIYPNANTNKFINQLFSILLLCDGFSFLHTIGGILFFNSIRCLISSYF